MNQNFNFLPVAMMKEQAMLELKQCNDYSARFGLLLSEQEISMLIESRKDSLSTNGRIEFGGGIIKKLILEFADSPYIDQDNYADILTELQDCFYYFKNETLEDMTDDELILLMKDYYNDECQGSVEYLQATVLENISRDIRYRSNYYKDLNGYEDEYSDFLNHQDDY
ncbi:MAG: hypothetical protein K0S47_1202 [Herbinix sp.]|jgi:hypothetical protein|nr:hypothetical protein [Herbinix sp.]